jgi:serine protease Do
MKTTNKNGTTVIIGMATVALTSGYSAEVGSSAQLRVLRGGQIITVNARLDELKEETPRTTPGAPTTPDNDTTTSPTALGLRLRALTPELAREFGVEGSRGVLVTGVVEGSPAAEVGLRRGDVVERVGQRTVTTPQEMQNAVNGILNRQSGDSKRVALYVNRKGERSYVTVTTEK